MGSEFELLEAQAREPAKVAPRRPEALRAERLAERLAKAGNPRDRRNR